MPNQVFMIHAVFDNDQRARLLDAFPPLFENIYCRQLVWAYRIPDDFVWPQHPLAMTVIGHHASDGHQALVCSVELPGATVTMQALGNKRLHVTLSTATGVAPASGGDIEPDKVRPVEPLSLTIRLRRGHAMRLAAEHRA
jgi:hypothetical protein